ncbi:MAG: hypothetical protein ACRCTU_18935 [Zoogloea sp.]|uniref:hypothetical protein n=1 Tax=Zoogloea sp. TaxID=49181 RepID=UPI003F2DA39A
METSLLLSMAGFALAMSITPGPVNLVALGSGARHGFAASLRHVVLPSRPDIPIGGPVAANPGCP